MKISLLPHLLVLLSFFQIPAQSEEGIHQRLDWYPDGVETVPIETREHWEIRRAAILKGFERAIGKMPARKDLPELDMQVTEVIHEEKFTRSTMTILSEGEDRIPCYLYVPTGVSPAKRVPGIVALHPTHKIGKGVVDGQSERPNRGYARELAERGNIVIAPDYLSFGELSDYDFAGDKWESGTAKAIWNHMRCVDYLLSREDVDEKKIATIGHSLGGHNAIFLGVFDERVKVVVSSCGWTPFHDYKEGNITGWTSDRYMPALRDKYELNPDKVPFDFYELVAALAPRAFFSNSPLRDSNFDWRGVEKAAPKIRKIYDLYGLPRNLRIAYPDSEHDFPEPVRMESFEFIDSVFNSPGNTPPSPEP